MGGGGGGVCCFFFCFFCFFFEKNVLHLKCESPCRELTEIYSHVCRERNSQFHYEKLKSVTVFGRKFHDNDKDESNAGEN